MAASALTRLPFELTRGIMDMMDPVDRICLLLTNKQFWAAHEKDPAWKDDFSAERLPGYAWKFDPALRTWQRHPREAGFVQLVIRLERDAPGTHHVCPNCHRLHPGRRARSSLYNARYDATQGFIPRFLAGFCGCAGSSGWEAQSLSLHGSRRAVRVAQKMDFHLALGRPGTIVCHRVSRVLFPASAVRSLGTSGPVILALSSSPFVICSHFALRYMNTTDVPVTDIDATVYADDDNHLSHLDTSMGWILPFDPQDPQSIPSGRTVRGRYYDCSACSTTYGLTAHFHGEAGVEVVLDVFNGFSSTLSWEKCWKPNSLCPENPDPQPHHPRLNRLLRRWVFTAGSITPGESALCDATFGAAARALQETA